MRFILLLCLLSLPALAEDPEGAGKPWNEKPEERIPEPLVKVSRYLIAGHEIAAFQLGLNLLDRKTRPDAADYASDWESIRWNTSHSWVFDTDPFPMNQLLHPLGGTIYYGFARSTGLSYWESLGYTFAGSTLWEIAGETTRPSINDEITTTLAGSLFGEALFRIAQLWLEPGGRHPGLVRELGAALVSPPTGFNRFVFGRLFDEIYPSHDPITFTRLKVGGGWNAPAIGADLSSEAHQLVWLAEFAIDYGIPGKPGYTYDRPFDYFRFEIRATSSPNAIAAQILIRGLLLGSGWAAGREARGCWGLFGIYDYMSPEIFRVSNTAAAFGTVLSWSPDPELHVRAAALLGLGYGAAGTVSTRKDRDYHFGATPQAVLDLDIVGSNLILASASLRDYFVSSVGSDDHAGTENILKARAAVTVRVWGQHAVGVEYEVSRREAHYRHEDRRQLLGTLSVVYTLLGDDSFGVR